MLTKQYMESVEKIIHGLPSLPAFSMNALMSSARQTVVRGPSFNGFDSGRLHSLSTMHFC
ncbi:MAG: hypothetical protein ACLSAH_22430 [Bilophila wadsworthia]